MTQVVSLTELNSINEKLELEHQAAKYFMRCYEHDTGLSIRHLWHNRPNKPDVSCLLAGHRLDLEIAHLYGSEQEAMQILGRELSEKTRQELHDLETNTQTDQRLLKALNCILINKSHKQYKTNKVWLVIRNAHPAWDSKQIKDLLQCIDVPKHHPFEQIWLIGDWAAKSGIVQLYAKIAKK